MDPDGHLFFSTGADSTSTWMGTRTEGRDDVFAALPPRDLRAPTYRTNQGPLASFYTWNLARRFGTNYSPPWVDLTLRRMDAWGFNTIANWSDPRLWAARRKPYIVMLRGWGIDAGAYLGMPDVFSEEFPKKADAAAAEQCAPRKDDPWLVGYFVANEPPWPGRETQIAAAILEGPANPIQRELKTFLGDADTPARRREFVNRCVEKFLEVVNAAIRRHDPNHLNLGLRFGNRPSEEMLRASRGFDVFSMNSYAYEVNRQSLETAYRITGKPILIGEFHFGTPGRGLAAGLVQCANQEERGAAYRYYVENAAAHPALSPGERENPWQPKTVETVPGVCASSDTSLKRGVNGKSAILKTGLCVCLFLFAARPPVWGAESADVTSGELISPASSGRTSVVFDFDWRFSKASAASVKAWETTVTLPTYAAGEPEPDPMFYFGRNSQGAQGRVYPYPLYDTLTHVKADRTFRIVYLENEYIRAGILPEIGGRLFEAVDKSNGYNFVYRQHVIKPALIGLIGAWMSGGIEWNIPHHHRATTFLPVQSRIEANADGSQTVWVGELELRQRMRWAVGYTLSPGSSCLTAKVRIINRTPFANTMLCFANLAVQVNENYQVIFPPSTQFVTYHGKREFAAWPVATGRYSGADFGNGTDVSWYSNHISANSMFAWNYQDDFFAGYDHGKEASTMSVADHHVVPGKKFWTWGNGPRGRMWDKILTDNDGPYIELMVGAFSDNQPDYSWLEPYETKSFELHWYPFRDIGGVKNANLDAAVNLEVLGASASPPASCLAAQAAGAAKAAKFGFCTTAAHRAATVLVKAGDKVLFKEGIEINPAKPFLKQIPLPGGIEEHNLRASLSVAGKELVAYTPVQLTPVEKPEPVKGPPPPSDLKTVEELYLAGRRIEQFHAPGQEPEPYWDEALRRDPEDERVNVALGIRQLKQARFAEAEGHLRLALKRLTQNYTAPREGEPYYYLGVAQQAQGKDDAAFDNFGKAIWSEAWRGPAGYAMAEIASRRGTFPAALDYVTRSLEANALNLRALTLKAAALRHLGRTKEALGVLAGASEQTGPLDVRLMAERHLAGSKADDAHFFEALRCFPNFGLEAAVEYGNAGLWQDGMDLLELMISCSPDKGTRQPMAYYYLAYFAEQLHDREKAAEYRRLARLAKPDYTFPFQWESIAALRSATAANPDDARAPYYLGNLLYDWQPEEATKLWEQSASLAPAFPLVHRNLAVAYSHRKPTPDLTGAIAQLEQAVAGSPRFALHFAELDELYASAGVSPEKRLALLEQNQAVVSRRDDALSREIGLKIFAGKCDEAISLMTSRQFAVWEGGTLEVAEHWVQAHLRRGRQELAAGKSAEALADFECANAIPDNLPSDQRRGGHSAEIAYWLGVAREATGDLPKAKELWTEAAGNARGGPRRGPDDRGLERQVQTCFQALARRKLGQTAEAETALRGIVEAAERALNSETERREGPEGSSERSIHRLRAALAHYVAGLAYAGLNEKEKARSEFNLALQSAPDYLGAKTELACVP